MIKDKDILLRPLRREDVQKINSWRNDLSLIKMTQGLRFPKPKELDEDWINNTLLDKSNKNIYFAIEVDNDKEREMIGVVQLTQIDYTSRTAVLGIMLGDPKNQGKGYGFIIYNNILEYAFSCLNIRKIISYVVSYNDRSFSLYNKIQGFEEEGVLRKHFYFDGEYHDVCILSIFKDDFVKK